MSVLVFDIESNGLLEEGTEIFCIVTQDVDTLEVKQYYESEKEIYQGLLELYNADCIIGHNIISFDIPFIQKFYPKWRCKDKIDTFICSSIFDPERKAHSLESYLGGLKVFIDDWSCLTYEVLDRCTIDVIGNTRLYHTFKDRIESKMWKEAIKLEQQVAENHVKQVRAGVDVDIPLVHSTIECLDAELEALRELIEDQMAYRCMPGGQYKKVFKKDGDLQHYVKGYFKEAISCLKLE